MQIKVNRYITIVILFAILTLGFLVRLNNFSTIPRHGATFDEFAWTWLGINLIQTGAPVSWSPHPQYKQRQEIKYQGAAFLLVRPYLEHPPLFGLAAGSFALLAGVKDMYDVTLEKIRLLALILGVFSIFIVFILTKEVYGKGIALIASLLYATAPSIVIGSRIVQNENFLIPTWLLSLYLVTKYLKTGKKRFRNIAAILAGLLALAKIPWLVVGLSLSMILSYKGKWRDGFFVGAVTLLIFSLFIIYGVYYDKELFFSLWQFQTARYDITFDGFFAIFKDPLLVDRYYLDGWIYFGWLSILLLLKDLKKHFIIAIPFVAYLALFIFAIPNEPGHGWYRYPFYPFLLISTALVLKDELNKISLAGMLVVLIVGLALLSNTWGQVFGFSFVVYRLFILAAFLSFLLPLWLKRAQKLKLILLTWFGILVIINIWATMIFVE